MNIIFSLVLYKQNLGIIKPLFLDIDKFYNYGLKKNTKTLLNIYDNSPSINNDITKLIEKDYISYVHDSSNLGYGRAHNKNLLRKNFSKLNTVFIVVNPDITFNYIDLFNYLQNFLNSKYLCVAPLVINEKGEIQYSAKKNPTLLSLIIGRFNFLRSLKIFDNYQKLHLNQIRNYKKEKIQSSYLSGCFLIIRSTIYRKVKGFDNRYFLHLEDADFTRKCSYYGLVMHDPNLRVVHKWARGSHKSLRQMLCILISLIKYFKKWGIVIF